MENYEKKLKEALVDVNTDYEVVRWIEQTFPELKESEDGRIRNFLIDFIKVCGWTEKKDQGWPLREECIAWLEKQGEKKLLNNEQYQTIPIETLDRLYAAEKELAQLKQKVEPKFKIGDTVWLKTNTHEYTKTIEDMDDECYIFNDGRILTFNCQDDWELVEQKPAFEMKTPEESLGIDSDTYNEIVDECVYGEQKPVDADLKDVVDKEANAIWKEINTGGSHSIIDSFNQFYGICMQVAEAVVDCKKPAEWSEEDEIYISDVMWCIEQARKVAKNENDMGTTWCAKRWVKSLKDRVQPQPKQAWSGGDEAHLHSLVTHLEQWIEKHPNTTGADIQGENVAWLKSIRPQHRWKPSDLPHWKKSTLPNNNTTGFNSDYFCYKGYYIDYKELFEKLQKDEKL